MDAERKAVVLDVGLGALCVAMGLLYASRATLPYWWLAPVVALATAVLAWADDHGVVRPLPAGRVADVGKRAL